MPARSILAHAALLVLLLLAGRTHVAHGQSTDARTDTSRGAVETVLERTALDRRVATSTIDMLRTVPGVHIAQTGVDQYALALRGFGALRGEPLVLVDGRPAALPGLGMNRFSLMPIQRVDLERIEVVHGPRAAAYGLAAAGGVVRFISKNPFDDPGTDVAVSGGSGPYVSTQLRHAADVGGTFGYEATAYVARGHDERLDPTGPAGRRWLAYDHVFDDPDDAEANQRVDVESGRLLRDEDYRKIGIHGRFAYRLSDRTTIAAQGGYASLTARSLSEVGALQADFLGYSFAQLQLDSGNLSARLILNNNEAGDSYLYGTGQPVMDRSVQYVARTRYRFARPVWRTAFTVGGTANWRRPRTDGTLVGRNEERDGINAYGAHVRAVTSLSPHLQLTLALRGDIDNLARRPHLAPHAALAYDLAPAHTVYVRYDRAVGAPGVREYFFDAEVRRRTLLGPYDLVHRAHGAERGFTFDSFRARGEAVSLVPRTGQFGRPMTVDAIPLRLLYQLAGEQFDTYLSDATHRPDAVQSLSAGQIDQLVGALRNLTTRIAEGASTRGALGIPQGSGGYTPVVAPVDVPPLARPITQAIELGYRGSLDRRVELSADAYYVRTTNAVGPLEVASPLVYTPSLAADLRDVLEPAVAQRVANPDAPLGTLLEVMDLSTAEAAQLAAGLAAGVYADTPVGVVSPDQSVFPGRTTLADAGLLLTYRNYDRLQYVGANVGVRVRFRDGIEAFGGLSLVSDDLFTARAVGDAATVRTLALNAPAFKAHLGVDVALTEAWTMHATGRYAAGFPVRAGLYAGHVEAAAPIDLGLRYDARRLAPGLRLELTVRNALNQAHRAFVGAPALGRMALVRLSYTR